MTKTNRRTMTLALGLWLTPHLAQALEVSELQKEDIQGFGYFRNALSFDEVQQLPSRTAQIRRVARDMGWKSTRLQSAIERYESIEGDVMALAAEAAKQALEASRVKGRVVSVEFDDSNESHVVAYIRWRGTSSKEVIKDASSIAHAINEATPFVSTVSLAAIHPKAKETSKRNVWEGKVGDVAMARIQPDRIEDYADRLYKRMFEDVKELPF
ncbi:MAG: hypothetical protein AAGD10_16030 [Myxococcota bacterium]